MEQAVNTFQKGLNTDSHPMAQGNDSLTDALNATFITQNGNEIILQNDMGNRRIDNAFLPSGYQPVGMKEYGGIIYVAAYNPITNKSQIGSFPSPERKIDVNDDNKLSGELNIKDGQYFSFNTKIENGIKFLNSDTILIPLEQSSKNSILLHAGDKFVVYCDNIENYKDLLSNYDNTVGDKVISPKNRLYTLSLGILNSQNEFVDITSSLERWDGNNIVENLSDKSNIYKFNYKYFIPTGLSVNESSLTIDDNTLRKEREIRPANTYSYKLVGPLYLKCQLNHINSFNYNIYGEKDTDNRAKSITIEATITYNCPDGINSKLDDDNGNEIYDGFYTGIPSSNFFDLYVKEHANSTTYKIRTNQTSNISSCSYNPDTNLYTVVISKTYTNVKATSGSILKYYICVSSDICNKDQNLNNVYIKELSQEGELDLSLLNTGTISILDWRFLNDVEQEQTLLSYSFDIYPKKDQEFQDLVLRLTPYSTDGLENNKTIQYFIPGSITRGNITTTLYWDQALGGPINPRKLYKVELHYSIVEQGIEWAYSNVMDNSNLWLLTTELLNNCYSLTSPEFVSNYSDVTNPIMQSYLTIKPKDYFNVYEVGSSTVEEEGSMIVSTNDTSNNYQYKWKYTYNGELRVSTTINELYPDCIILNEIPVLSLSNPQQIENLIIDNLSYKYIWYDKAIGNSLYTVGSIDGLFKKISQSMITNGYDNFGIGIMNHGRDNHRDYHELLVTKTKSNSYSICNGKNDNADDEVSSEDKTWDYVDSRDSNGAIEFVFSEYENYLTGILDKLYAWGKGSPVDSIVFSESGPDKHRYATINYFRKGQNFSNLNDTSDSSCKKSRLWWRTENGEYALYDDLISQKDDIYNIFQNFVYRLEEKKNFSDLNIGVINVSQIDEFGEKQYALTLTCTNYNRILKFPNVSDFIFKLSQDSEDIYYTPYFNSSDEFSDYVNSFPTNYIQNVYIDNNNNIKLVDGNNNPLDTTSVYILSDGKLYPTNNFKMTRDIRLDLNENYNGFVFVPTIDKSSPTLRYNIGWFNNDDQKTSLLFDSVYVIPKIVDIIKQDTSTPYNDKPTGNSGHTNSSTGHIVPKQQPNDTDYILRDEI